jgi:hypothetical protein
MSGWEDVSLFKPFTSTLKAYRKSNQLLSSDEWIPADEWAVDASQYATYRNEIGIPYMMQDIIGIAFPLGGLALDGLNSFVKYSDEIAGIGEQVQKYAHQAQEFAADVSALELPELTEGSLYTYESNQKTGGFGGDINWEAIIAPFWNSLARSYNLVLNEIGQTVESVVHAGGNAAELVGQGIEALGSAGESVGDVLNPDWTEGNEFTFHHTGNAEADAELSELESQIQEFQKHTPPPPGTELFHMAKAASNVVKDVWDSIFKA